MNKVWRWVLLILSALGIVTMILPLNLLFRQSRLTQSVATFLLEPGHFWTKFLIFLLFVFIMALFAFGLAYAIWGGNFRSKRSYNNDYGDVEIGEEAIENIALNSAKTAQAGIKAAKADISSNDEQTIDVVLEVVLYSDVEIPQQMRKIQERVKKDIEKYTGIAVSSVVVNVKRVELLGTMVER